MNPFLAFLDMIGGSELMLVFLIVLVLFGGEKLPDVARGLGKSLREIKKATAGVEEEIKKALAATDEAAPPKTSLPAIKTVTPEPAPAEDPYARPHPHADEPPSAPGNN